jgi:hypothetical protein
LTQHTEQIRQKSLKWPAKPCLRPLKTPTFDKPVKTNSSEA